METRPQAELAVETLLQWVGEDPARDGLRETPARVIRSLAELCDGYRMDPAQILAKRFACEYDAMVILRRAPFYSLCEHHLLPFHGTATIAYIPDPGRGFVVGISKLARLLDCFAHRLQIQERLSQQIAQAIDNILNPVGVGVIIRAEHLCMSCRGVRKPGSDMVTSALTGVLRENPSARAELLNLER